jgi:restriction endonuclease S subunit
MLYYNGKKITGSRANLKSFAKRFKLKIGDDDQVEVVPGSYLFRVVSELCGQGKIKKVKSLPVISDKAVYRNADKPKPVKKRRVTGERALFREIIAERGARSEISGDPLITDENNKFWVNQFMHVLPKSNYPEFRLMKENIFLGTKDEHDVQTRRPDKIKNSPKWAAFFKRYDELRSTHHLLH